jgi:hypothetical protein
MKISQENSPILLSFQASLELPQHAFIQSMSPKIKLVFQMHSNFVY